MLSPLACGHIVESVGQVLEGEDVVSEGAEEKMRYRRKMVGRWIIIIGVRKLRVTDRSNGLSHECFKTDAHRAVTLLLLSDFMSESSRWKLYATVFDCVQTKKLTLRGARSESLHECLHNSYRNTPYRISGNGTCPNTRKPNKSFEGAPEAVEQKH